MASVAPRRLLVTGAQVVVVALAFLAGGLMLPRVVGATISSGERDAFVPLPPGRILDTRSGPSPTGPGVKLGAGDAAVIELPVLGQQGVPANATAVVLNITTVNATAPSHLTIFPTGTTRPLASSTNFAPGTTVPNAVTVKLGTGGKISIFNNVGLVDVIADVNGYYDDHNHDDSYYTKSQADNVAAIAAAAAITTPNHVGTGQIADGGVGTNDLAGNAVTSPKIADGGVGGADLANDSVTSAKIDDGTVTMADLDTSAPLFAVTLNNGTTIAPGACIIRTGSSASFLPAGKLATATFESGTIPDNIAFFAGTTKAGTTPNSGVAPFQICNHSTSTTATFTGTTFNLRIRVID